MPTDKKNLDQISTENLCQQDPARCLCLEEIDSLRKEVQYLTEQVRTDALTSLYNFRFFNEALVLEIERSLRTTQSLSMILLDIDHFKKFNDQWGHDNGNKALVHVANMIKIAVRKLDLPCRFGGEEFAILLPNTDLRQAIQVAERLRETIATTHFYLDADTSLVVTASLGVAQFLSRSGETSDAYLKRVDQLLYEAKQNGRNCIAHPVLTPIHKVDSVSQAERDILFGFDNPSDS